MPKKGPAFFFVLAKFTAFSEAKDEPATTPCQDYDDAHFAKSAAAVGLNFKTCWEGVKGGLCTHEKYGNRMSGQLCCKSCLAAGDISSDEVCKSPTDIRAYQIEEYSLARKDFHVAVKCAAGYTGKAPVAKPCDQPGGTYFVHGCYLPFACLPPLEGTFGYIISEQDNRLDSFDVIAECESGYVGSARVKACTREGHEDFGRYSLYGCRKVADSCPKPFAMKHGSCYWMSSEKANFVDCQRTVCTDKGASLATAYNASLQDFFHSLVQGIHEPAFVGLYQRGPEQEGDWRWVDGSGLNYHGWHQGEPNNWCVKEDCAIYLPAGNGWFDAACSLEARCICQYGTAASEEFTVEEPVIKATRGGYGSCKGGSCFWVQNSLFQTQYAVLGIPCMLLILHSLWCPCWPASSTSSFRQMRPHSEPSQATDRSSTSEYGLLMDPSDFTGDSDSIVRRRMLVGALSEILYSLLMLLLALTLLAHTKGFLFSFMLDATEALLMSSCKFAVGWSTLTVHNKLSPAARAVTGNWVAVLAASKMSMGFVAWVLAGVYMSVDFWKGYKDLRCLSGYVFCWGLLLSLICESVAGLVMTRIYVRAADSFGDAEVFSRVVQCWWNVLIFGSFGVGLGLGLAGTIFVFDNPLDNFSPVMFLPFCYLGAAASQLVAGWAVLVIDTRTGRITCKLGAVATKIHCVNSTKIMSYATTMTTLERPTTTSYHSLGHVSL